MVGVQRSRAFYTGHPWRCSSSGNKVLVQAFVEASSHWEAIIEVRSSSDASAKDLSGYIARVINEHSMRQAVLNEVKTALELIEEEGMTYSSELAADHALRRLKQLLE
jgi:hypothetical protein